MLYNYVNMHCTTHVVVHNVLYIIHIYKYKIYLYIIYYIYNINICLYTYSFYSFRIYICVCVYMYIYIIDEPKMYYLLQYYPLGDRMQRYFRHLEGN